MSLQLGIEPIGYNSKYRKSQVLHFKSIGNVMQNMDYVQKKCPDTTSEQVLFQSFLMF